MDTKSVWEYIDGLPSVNPEKICKKCHECTDLYEDIAKRVIKALEIKYMTTSELRNFEKNFNPNQMQNNTEDLKIYLNAFESSNILAPDSVKETRRYLQSKISRLKRISGLYAKSFNDLNALNVRVPFVGAAAFASNVVGWELEKQIDKTLALHPGWVGSSYMPDFGVLSSGTKEIRKNIYPIFLTTIEQVFDGNVVVFVEIFAIFAFCIKHFQKFRVPTTENDLKEFDNCLKQFIKWWDRVQPSNRKESKMANIKVDREQLIHEGIMMCLRGDYTKGSTDFILKNEQLYTLQDYMYDIIDSGAIDEMELGLLVGENVIPNTTYEASAKFVYNLNEIINDKYIVTFKGGIMNWNWITEASDRYPYTIKVVERFSSLYYNDSNAEIYLKSQLFKMIGDASGY